MFQAKLTEGILLKKLIESIKDFRRNPFKKINRKYKRFSDRYKS